MKQKIKKFFKRLLAVLLLMATLGTLNSIIKGDYSIFSIFVGLMCLFFAVLLLKERKPTDTTTNNSDSIPVPDNSRNQFVERPSTIYNPDTNAFSRNEISSPIPAQFKQFMKMLPTMKKNQILKQKMVALLQYQIFQISSMWKTMVEYDMPIILQLLMKKYHI